MIGKLSILITSALIAELIAHYLYATFRTANDFQYATFIAYTAWPALLVATILKVPARELGISLPMLNARDGAMYTALIVAATVVAIPVLRSSSYQAAYAGHRDADLSRFVLFAVSTTIPSEFLHRGYLLFGVRHVLGTASVARAYQNAIAILLVMSFEVLFHLTKPPAEAIALLVASPLLSFIALRSKSLFLPLISHTYVEVLFFCSVIKA